MVAKTESAQSTPEPSQQVLSLVSAFLSENGFESTSKALKKELRQKNKTADVEAVQDGVNLQVIVESWNTKAASRTTSDQETSEEDEEEASSATSDSESGSSSATSSGSSDEGVGKEVASSDSDSGSEPTSESESDSEEEATKMRFSKLKRTKLDKREASPTTSSSSSSSSSSDSDADDEDENEGVTVAKIKAIRKKSPTIVKKSEAVRGVKRKAESSSSGSSSSESESSDEEPPAKRARVASDSGDSSSEDSSAESEDESSDDETSSSEEEQKRNEESNSAVPESLEKLMNAAAQAASDSSSNTVMGDVMGPEEISSDAGSPQARSGSGNQKTTPKKKHIGARPTPLAQLSQQAGADAHISNAYRSYDYADRAYNDLSVTRGKGFTKEKNKKKRGSYRGGAIDISGGKSFKFDD